MEHPEMSKKELVEALELLKKENSELKAKINEINNFKTVEKNTHSGIPNEIKKNLDNGNIVVPYFSFPHSYMLTDMQGNVLFACPNMLHLFGYDKDFDYANKSIFNYLAPERLERAKSFFLEKKFYKEESIGIKANGERFYIEINGNIIYNTDGEPTNIIFLVRDIDQRKKNEERLQVLSNAIEQSPVTVVITDFLGKIEYANPKAIETTGYQIEELIGQNPRVLKSGETPFEEYKKMWETIKSGETWHGFFHNKKKNGALYWESSTIAPILNERGDIVRFVAIKEDVTEKKHLEEVIKNQNIRLNAIVQAFPDLIFIINKDGVYTDFSAPIPFRNALLGPELIGKKLEDIFGEKEAEIHKKHIVKCIESKVEISYEYKMYEGDAEIQFEARLIALDNEKVFAVVRNVTEERKISAEMTNLSLAVTQSPVAVVITDVDGKIVFTNPAFFEITGYASEEVYGKKVSILKSGLNSNDIYANLWETITTGKVWINEWINKKKDGTLYWESVSISPVLDKKGNITNYLSVKEDITERKRYEKEILDLNQNLEKKIEERTSELTEINKNFLKEIVDRKKAEKALQEKSDELETFFEVTLDLLSMHDIDGRIIKINKAWVNTLGYEPEYFQNRNIIDLFHPDDKTEAEKVLKQLQKPGEVINLINRCRKSDGTYIYFEWCTTSDGNRIYTAGRDITERKRSEEFEMELLHLSTHLTGMPRNKMEEAINLALSKIGKYLAADRTSIFKLVREKGVMSNVYEWCNDGVPSYKDSLRDIKSGVLPMWQEKLFANENIIIPSVKNLPDSWKAEKEIFLSHGFNSVMGMPISSENKLYGFVGIDIIKDGRVYSDFDISILNIWKNILMNLISKFEADKLLEIAQRNFEIFFNTIDDFLSVIDKNGNIIHVNNTVLQRLNYTKEELEGHSLTKIYPQKTIRDLINNIFENALDDSEFTLASLKSKNNINISVETRLKLGSWNGDTAIFCVSKDISKLLLSEQKFSTVFELGSAIMSISDYDTGVFIDVNNSFVETSGYTKEEIIGSAMVKNRLFDRQEIINKINNNSPVRDMEINVILKNGDIKTAVLSADAIYIGERKCLLTISVDITDRKKSEELLQWNKSLLELMSGSSPYGFLVVDNETDKILYFNKRFCEIWDIVDFMPQMSSGALKNRDLRPQYSKSLENADEFFESVKPLYDKSNRAVISDEIPFVGNRTIRRFSTQIRGANDIYFGRFYIFEDVTETKLTEEKLRIARIEAEKANDAKSEFLSRMSHELRTPLNSILGFAQLLEMTELNDVQKRGTYHILNSGNHLLDLINEVLDISRIEAGRLVLSIESILLSEIILEIIDVLQPLAVQSSVKIEFIGSEEKLFVKSDRQSLTQILLNLLTNAIKYNKPNGFVKISVINIPNSDKVTISISDSGIGISEENLPRIFDPFERIGADFTSIEGTGLGLSVVKKLLNALGSEIYVESSLGNGSTFYFDLPKGTHLHRFNHLLFDNNNETIEETCKKTVLYIEDNHSNVELLEEIVVNSCPEIKLYSESSGQKAIDVAKKIKPDVILLDLNLPDVNGTEVLINLRNAKTLSKVPIIIISADALPNQIEQVMNLGATLYITKPFDVKQIIDIFKNI